MFSGVDIKNFHRLLREEEEECNSKTECETIWEWCYPRSIRVSIVSTRSQKVYGRVAMIVRDSFHGNKKDKRAFVRAVRSTSNSRTHPAVTYGYRVYKRYIEEEEGKIFRQGYDGLDSNKWHRLLTE